MIEWWQAIVFSLTTILGTGVVAWAIQWWRLRHEGELHSERLQFDQKSEQAEAVRASRRERLRPVYDVLAELDAWLAWQSLLSAEEQATGPTREELARRYPDRDVDALFAAAVRSVRERSATHKPQPDLPYRVIAMVPRVPGIEADVIALVGALNLTPDNWGFSMYVLRRLHERVEAFAAQT